MENTNKISKEIKQKIRRYHYGTFKIFLILIILGFSSLVFAYIVSRISIYFKAVNVTTIYITIGITYIFAICTPLSLFFLYKFLIIDSYSTKELFYNKYHLENIIDELISNHNEDKICEFQKSCRKFNFDFNYLFWNYFKRYKKRIKASGIVLMDHYIDFEKILNLVSVNVEIQSKETIQLLNDFSEFLHDTQDKLLIKILDKNIQMNDVKNFIGQKTNFFKNNYKKKYQESSKIIERYVDIQRKKGVQRQLNFINIVSSIIAGVIIVIIGILIKYFAGINL